MAQAGGWLKLWRSWLNHEVARDAKAWLVLTHLLCRAVWEPRVNRRMGYTLAPGECDETLEQLASATGLTYQAVKEAIKRLVKYETIKRTLHHNPRRTITSLVNWAFYQSDTPTTPEDAPDQQQTSNRRTPDPKEPKTIQEPEEEKTTTNDLRELSGYIRHAVGYNVDSATMAKLVLQKGFWMVVEAAEHLAARPPKARLCRNPPGLLSDLADTAQEEDGLERKGDYEPFENWRARQREAAAAKLEAIAPGKGAL